MSGKPKSIHDRQSRFHLLLLPVVVACSSLLASCGGGNDSSSTAESADGTKQALAVSGSSAVPGGWTGRAPKMEVINGITVPPEPAPAVNNATVAGVDVNNNGVRDDVERRLAKYTPASTWSQAIDYAKLYEAALRNSAPTTRANALAYYKRLQCFVFSGDNKAIRYPGGTSMMDAVFNTPERSSALSKYAVLVGGYDDEEIRCE